MKKQELRLDYCDECGKLTNHIGDECQKCKAKELKNYDIDDDFERTEKKYKRNKFEDDDDY